MAKVKSTIRKVEASGDIVGLIDHGYDVDTQLKNLTFEDAGVKKILLDKVSKEMKEEEKSVNFIGKKASAMVTQTQKYNIDCSDESIEEIKKLANLGMFDEAVKTEVVLKIPESYRERVAKILGAVGIEVETVVNVSVDPEAYRQFMKKENNSVEHAKAKKLLGDSVVQDVNYRIKYSKI
jgi:hypothetical protein